MKLKNQLLPSMAAMVVIFSSGIAVANDELEKKFNEARQSLLPLSPAMIESWYEQDMSTSAAVNRDPIQGDRVSQTVSLDPGVGFPQIVLTPGYVSSVRFIDSVGTPWKITSYSLGNPNWFSLNKPDGLMPGNLLTLSALSPKAHSNIMVTLDGLNDPVSISIITSDMTEKGAINGSVTYQIPGMSPDAPTPIFSDKAPMAVSNLVMDVLNNVLPKDARKIKTDNPDVSVWEINNQMYVRTTKQIVWPAWEEDVSGGSIKVYRVPMTSRLRVSDGMNGSVSVSVDL